MSDVITDQTLDAIKQMARAAGHEHLRYHTHVVGKLKGFRDFVTDADLAAESVVIKAIHETFPTHSIISEEGGGSTSSSEYCWFIDPLDGTKNYVWGIPLSAVSIALAFRGRVCMGVIYDPRRDEMFWGRAGHGVYLNDQRVQVGEHHRLAESLVATDCEPELVDLTAAMSASIQREVASLRALGSATLAFAYVACGRLDSYFHYRLNQWDMAAGGFLLTEAGGKATDIFGGADYLNNESCLATNGFIHDEILQVWRRNGLLDKMRAQRSSL